MMIHKNSKPVKFGNENVPGGNHGAAAVKYMFGTTVQKPYSFSPVYKPAIHTAVIRRVIVDIFIAQLAKKS